MFLLVGLVAFLTAFSAQGQVYSLTNSLSPYATSDTVTNSGTGTLTTRSNITAAPAVTTTFRVYATEISGTTGGTITLMGSMDGTTYKAITTPNTVTALATHTATDVATNQYDWIISGSPFPYYRVSWTGTGTMSASFTAVMFRSK